MNIKIDDLVFIRRDNKIIIENIGEYDIEFNTNLKQIILNKRIQNMEESKEGDDEEEEENNIDDEYVSEEQKIVRQNIQGSTLVKVYVNDELIDINTWKDLYKRIAINFSKEELMQMDYVKKIDGRSSEEQRKKDKYLYWEEKDISLKSSNSVSLIREIFYLNSKKYSKLKFIYSKDNTLYEYQK